MKWRASGLVVEVTSSLQSGSDVDSHALGLSVVSEDASQVVLKQVGESVFGDP